ncbi:MAG: TIGR02206 family membrane protein [Schleiferiaceae bacterium]|nr:TIGR02206 family membrane protein [Schleiferiaceae bacterium]
MSFLQIEHAVYSIGSEGWLGGIGIFALYGAIVVFFALRLKTDVQFRLFEKYWGLALIIMMLFKHLHLTLEGLWGVEEHLELHLCGLSRFLSIALLFFAARWAYYPLFFWGIVGGFHAVLTPELTGGDTVFMYIEYYVAHSGILIIPLYFHFSRGMRIGRWTWAKVLSLNIFFMFPIGIINYLSGANYMFLCFPPKVNSPFIIGEWVDGMRVCVDGSFSAFPVYILGFVVAGAAHYLVLTGLFWKSIKAEEAK